MSSFHQINSKLRLRVIYARVSNIDDAIFDKFMGLIDILPKDKIQITSHKEYPSISFEEAKQKVHRAVNTISENKGVPLSQAIDKVLLS